MTRVKKATKIALIGSYPPPYGGVTVHIQRLKNQLDEHGIENVVYDLLGKREKQVKNVVCVKNPKGWLFKYFFTAKENIIHSHISDWRLRSVICLMSFLGKKTIISIHGGSLNIALQNANFFMRQFIKLTLRSASYIIALNTNIEQTCLDLDIKPDRIKVIPSFFPPNADKELISEIDPDLLDFINNHNPIILSNAFKIRFLWNIDLYGLDLCIDLCAELRDIYPDVGFVFCLPEIGDYGYFRKMNQRIKEKGIESNFIFHTKQGQLFPIIMKSDIFVRPTNTDGDAVSIREALYFGIPVVASDAAPRPEATVLFRNRDINDFSSKVKSVLDNYVRHKKNLESIEMEDNFEKIVKIYQDLASHEE